VNWTYEVESKLRPKKTALSQVPYYARVTDYCIFMDPETLKIRERYCFKAMAAVSTAMQHQFHTLDTEHFIKPKTRS
jgi:hypothetical protein